MAFQALPLSINPLPGYADTSEHPGVSIILSPTSTTSPVIQFESHTDSLQQRLVKSLPDPLLLPPVTTGADISNFDDDGSTDDGSVFLSDATNVTHITGTENMLPATYFRMPVACPVLPTMPSAVLGVQSSTNTNNVADIAEAPITLHPIPEEGNANSQCLSCQHAIPNINAQVIKADCGHLYELECFQRLLTVSLRDTKLPACCNQDISARRFLHLISGPLKALYKEKEVEMMVDPAERLYCPYAGCGIFVGAVEDEDEELATVSCSKCAGAICKRCRLEAHDAPHADLQGPTSPINSMPAVYQQPQYLRFQSRSLSRPARGSGRSTSSVRNNTDPETYGRARGGQRRNRSCECAGVSRSSLPPARE